MAINSQSNSTGIYKGYVAPSGVTLTTPTILSVNYYDDYAFMGYNGIPASTDTHFKYETVSDYGVRYTGGYQGLLTGTMTAQLNSDGTVSSSYLYSVMYYDDRGRVIQSKSNSHLTGGTEAEYLAYNFTGQVTRRKHVHAATGKSTQTELYTYAYDTAGRLTTVKHKLNSGAEVTLANNTYDELGRLQTNQRNGNVNLKTTHIYNVRSWIKSITSTLFTQTLYYNDTYGGSVARYNGNISAMSWRVANEVINGTTTTKTRGYKFTYDNLSRLTASDYLENAVAKDYFNTVYTYDKHGNIKTLTRRGNTGTTTYGIIDNLTMSYSGNQLTKVEDTGTSVSLSASMDFKNGSNTATEYTYNKKGSLTKDANKGITSIAYNLLNLPRSLSISNNLGSGTNTYVYAADGRKLSTMISGKKTDYVGDVIYEDNVLKRILIDGGYIENVIYYFYLTDHLGNNRAVVSSGGALVQSNHYYPYGMLFTEGTQTSTQPFKFGGKELDIQKGLSWYDSQARMQDPVIPGFPTMDPLAEDYYSWSPYVYAMGNPMRFIDPDGRQVIPVPLVPPAPLPAPIYYSPFQSPYRYPTGQEIAKDVKSGINNMVEKTKLQVFMLGVALFNAYDKAVSPEYEHQRNRDRRNKEGLDKNQANVAKSIEDNVTATTPSGDPLGKRDPKDWGKWTIPVIGTGAGTAIGVQLMNPDPSKDANDAKREQLKPNQNPEESPKQNPQEENLIIRIIDWVIN